MAPTPLTTPWPFVGRLGAIHELRAELADAEIDAVVLTAPAGQGKTRLAREVTAAAALPPLWCQAAAAVREVPLGALADLLELGGGTTEVSVFHRLADRVADAGGVVVVDDAPHLDARSADLLHRLVDAGKATVLATARAGVPVPPWLEWLWLGDRTRHHDLAPLGEDDVAALVDLVLADRDAIERTAVVHTLTRRTAGNALFVRELLLDVRRRHDPGDALDVDGPVPPHLVRILDGRLRVAEGGVLEVVQAVGVLGSLAFPVLVARRGRSAVDAAEEAGYLAVDADPRSTVRPAHPLYAEAALASMTTGARRQVIEEVGRAVLDDPAATPSERLAAVTALLPLGAPVPAEHLVEAARWAFGALDHDLAVRVAEAAVEAGDRFEAMLVLGAAHSGAGRSDDADAALRSALTAAADDEQRARAAGRLAVHLVAHGRRLEEADEVLAATAAVLADPAAQAFVAADQAKLAAIRGDVSGLGEPGAVDGDDPAALNAAIVGAYAQAMGGDADACRATIARALPLAEAHRAVLPWSGELVRFSGTFAALVAEGPGAAEAEAEDGLLRAARTTEATVGTWRYLFGFAAAVAGRFESADLALASADRELDGHDLIGARPLAVAARAWVAAQGGDVGRARSLLDACVDAADVDGRVRMQVSVADAWCDAVEGAVTVAVTKLVDAAATAVAEGQIVPAVLALHDTIRIGAADSAVPPLRRLVAETPASWLSAFVLDRALAESRGDDIALTRVARRAAGRWPGGEAEIQAVRHRLAVARHDEVTAARAAVAALRAAACFEPVGCWTMRGIDWPLSDRERAVAQAVIGGARNREVAEAAGVSVRTVENQLQSIYRKLGIGGRAELAELLG